MNNRLIINKPVRLIELFAGIGSQYQALKNLEVECEAWKVVENDKFAIRSYNAIHGTNIQPIDIKTVHAEDLDICDTAHYTYLMTYSFPCQDLAKSGSRIGMGRESHSRSGLLWEVERILNECNELPQILLMENVADITSKNVIKDFEEWIYSLESLGYTNKYKILNATDYGMPQTRSRCFMLSWLGNYEYEFPEPIPLLHKLKDFIDVDVDEKYYMAPEYVMSYMRTRGYKE